MTDFYAVLGIPHNAEPDAIAKAYRRAAEAYNPACNPDHPELDQKELQRLFKLVSTAYVVLSDAKLRAVYDNYGEDGVRHGGTGKVGVPGGYNLEATDPDRVFRDFFGVDSPFQVMGDLTGVHNKQHQFYSSRAALPKDPPKLPVREVVVDVTLEDVFAGNRKLVAWENTDTLAGASVNIPASYDFTIPKGIAHNAHVVLPGQGNKQEGFAQGDVHLVINILPHDRIRREGDDLVISKPISLADALCGASLTVETIDGKSFNVLIDEVVHTGYRRKVEGEGMWVRNGGGSRGNLYVECPAIFPVYLTAEQKAEIRRIIDPPKNESK